MKETNLDDKKAPASCERTYKTVIDSSGTPEFIIDSNGNYIEKTTLTLCNPGPFDTNMNLVVNDFNKKCD